MQNLVQGAQAPFFNAKETAWYVISLQAKVKAPA
jgi:hypothetical protein